MQFFWYWWYYNDYSCKDLSGATIFYCLIVKIQFVLWIRYFCKFNISNTKNVHVVWFKLFLVASKVCNCVESHLWCLPWESLQTMKVKVCILKRRHWKLGVHLPLYLSSARNPPQRRSRHKRNDAADNVVHFHRAVQLFARTPGGAGGRLNLHLSICVYVSARARARERTFGACVLLGLALKSQSFYRKERQRPSGPHSRAIHFNGPAGAFLCLNSRRLPAAHLLPLCPSLLNRFFLPRPVHCILARASFPIGL